MVNQIYTCNKCRSVNQDNAFRLDAANFSQATISMYPVSGGGPMMPGMPGGAAGSTNRNETFHICSECKDSFNASLDELINPLKA